MPKTYKITAEQIAEIKEYRKINKDKNVEKRLRAVQLRGEGKQYKEIGEIIETHQKVVSRWVCEYVKEGINALKKGEYGGNRRNMPLEEESAFIGEFKAKAEKGELVTAKEIKQAYCEKIGHKCGKGQIYRVLKRQNWRKIVPRKAHPKKAPEAQIEASKKKINFRMNELRNSNFFCGYYDKIRLMFMDESVFGRITNIRSCWCPSGIRPVVSSLKIREYVYAYGAIDPVNGDSSFIIASGCDTAFTNLFLDILSKAFPNDYILLCADNAGWHKSADLIIPDNIEFFFIPPSTPELNPMEQIWDELKEKNFDNRFFNTLNKVADQLCDSINNLDKYTIKSIAGRNWIVSTA